MTDNRNLPGDPIDQGDFKEATNSQKHGKDLRGVPDRGGTLEMALSPSDEELSSIVYTRPEEGEREHEFSSQLDYGIKVLCKALT